MSGPAQPRVRLVSFPDPSPFNCAARAGRGSGRCTGFLTDPRRNAGADSIGIVLSSN